MSSLNSVREAAEKDLLTFARLVNPTRVYGKVHEEIFRWLIRPSGKDNRLVLIPRDHQKSHCAAVYAAWILTKDPTVTILYVSATIALAQKQLFAIKNIVDSEIYRRYWPDHILPEEGRRSLWTQEEIGLDHPLRKKEMIRDPTVKAAGLTTNITGFHATHVFLDDVVVPKNAYTEDGRRLVAEMYSQLASIETNGAKEIVVGTRYHGRDLYATLMEMEEEIIDEEGETVGYQPVYEVFERVVEEQGVFLWPKQRRKDGKIFGFDAKELARKKAKYVDRTQFYAQYYQNPNDPSTNRINDSDFNYYDRRHLEYSDGNWWFKDRKLNVFAAVDFAFSLNKRADYTAIVVIGIDEDRNVFILDIDRFKTGRTRDYYSHILALHMKWHFRKMRAEATQAQITIINELKEEYIKPEGIALKIDPHFPSRSQGTKEERVDAILIPRYENGSIYHYRGGLCTILEDEVKQIKPEHDDVKDTLAAAIDVAIPPSRRTRRVKDNVIQMSANSRFGGLYGGR